MKDSMLLSHPQLEDILITVKNMKLDGKTVLRISHELSRQFAPPNAPRARSWESCYVLQALRILRNRGDLPPSPLNLGQYGKNRYHEALEKIAREQLESN